MAKMRSIKNSGLEQEPKIMYVLLMAHSPCPLEEENTTQRVSLSLLPVVVTAFTARLSPLSATPENLPV